MRILFDQAVPVPLRTSLQGHTVETAYQRGWDTLTNGTLVSAAEQDGFDMFLTTDKNMRYQQNLSTRRRSVVVLSRQQWSQIRPRVHMIANAVNTAKPGSFTEVDIPAPVKDSSERS